MKKVLLSAYMCSPARGSESNIGWSWSIYLARKGYEVWCFTNVEDRDKIMEAHGKLNLPNLRFVFIDLPFGMDKSMLNISSKKIYLHYYLWKRKAAALSLKMHNDIHFDIAHHVSFASFQQGTYLWKLKNIRLIFGPVGGGQMALPAFKSYFGTGWRTEVIRSAISDLSVKYSSTLRNTIRKADYILVTNNDTGNLVKESKFDRPGKTHLVFDNAIPSDLRQMSFIERTPHKKINLLWVGRMLPRKGLPLVLHALSYLPQTVDYTLTIVGTGEQLPLLNGWINEYHLDPARIFITGSIPFSEVAAYYKKSDVFLFCSLRDSCPAQLGEAMAFGLPVVTLNLHGSALAVPDNCGIKITPGTMEDTAKDIANAVQVFYKNPVFREECSRNAFNYSKTNTWEYKIDIVTAQFY
jgi:glycosyltransferase involved in cell wall biosynthesis